MPIRRTRALVLAGVPLFALAACSDLLQDDSAPPTQVMVKTVNEETGVTYRVGYPVRVEAFVSDRGGLGVRSVSVSWQAQGGGSVQPDGERTNGNGFAQATWTPGTVAGGQGVRAQIAGDTASFVFTLPIAPDTVVGEVMLEAEADTLVEGEGMNAAITHAADRYGNAYSIGGTGAEGLPVSITSLDPAVVTVEGTSDPAAARVVALASGTGRVVARVGPRADTVQVVVKEFVPPGSFGRVNAGGYVTCGASPTGTAYCWGDNSLGQLGTEDGSPQRLVPAAVPALAAEAVERFGVGYTHACAVTAAGDAWCWGDNWTGQVGDGSFEARPAPVKVERPAGGAWVDVGVGILHTCALTDGGEAWCWGDNSVGELGNGDDSAMPSAVPVRVEAPAGTVFTALSVGGLHTCALTAAGTAWCWGANDSGQLADDSFINQAAPVEVPDVAFSSLGLGLNHSCGVSTAGGVYCWGQNFEGQLGDGTQEGRTAPTPVSGTLSATAVSAGVSHSCALAPDGRVFCWGSGISGRLGTGTEVPQPTPAEVTSGDLRFASLDVGAEHSCAIGTDNEAYCWGTNVFGELGNGVEGGAPSLEPRRVVSPLAPAASRRPWAAGPHRPSAAPRPRPAWCRELPAKASAKVRICR